MPDRTPSDADLPAASAESTSDRALDARGRPSMAPSLRMWLVVGAVIAVPLALFLLGLVVQGSGIAKGTSVAGVDLSGLSTDEAVARLDDELAPRLDERLVLVADKKKAAVVPAKVGITVDTSATVAAADTTGRDPLSVIRSLFGGSTTIDPVVTVDDAKLDAAAASASKKLDVAAREGGIRFNEDGYEAVEPRTGRSVEQAAAAQLIAAHAVAQERTVAAPVVEQQPTITQYQVDAAVAKFAKPAVSGPVNVEVDGDSGDDASVSVAVERFAPFLSATPKDGELVLTVDGEGLRTALSSSLGGIETEASDATFRVVGGAPQVVPAKDGRTVPADELATAFAAAAASTDERVASVALTTTEPSLTTAQARRLGVVEEISSFRQPFPYAPYRYQNIGQAAERINGTLLLPDETFSMNDTALERTPENGYTEGFVIQGGRLVEELGGGVSTITTAMWDAAFHAGLERVEQRAHSFYISRYKPGLEATVAWGQLDLKFKNNTGHGVFITAERGRNYVTVTMYGTKTVDVDAEFGARTNPKPYKNVNDTSANCTPQSGVNGFTIVVNRVISKDGTVIEREPLKTVYRPANHITCRPAPKPKSTAPASSAPSAKPATAPATPAR